MITFKIPSGTDDVAIVRTEDYISEVDKYENVVREQLRQHPQDKAVSCKLNAIVSFKQVLASITSLSTVPLKILISKLSENGSLTDDQDIRAVVRYVQR